MTPLRSVQILSGALLSLVLAGCSEGPPLPAARDATFDPIAFFTGPTCGTGTLDKLTGGSTPVRVESLGRRQGRFLILDQTISEGDKPPRMRRWTMQRVALNRYAGKLTDAAGPVLITIDGPRAHIRYATDDGLQFEQELALQRDGRTVLNRLKVTKFGLRLATLNEKISKEGST